MEYAVSQGWPGKSRIELLPFRNMSRDDSLNKCRTRSRLPDNEYWRWIGVFGSVHVQPFGGKDLAEGLVHPDFVFVVEINCFADVRAPRANASKA